MDTKNFKFIRGARISQYLEKEMLEETTYAELERNTMNFTPKTKKRQFAMAPVQVESMEFTPNPNANNLLVESIVRNYQSETKANAMYAPKILFQEIEFLRLEGLEEGIWDKAKEWWKGRKDRKDAAKALDDNEPVQDTEDAQNAIDNMDAADPEQPDAEQPEAPEDTEQEQPEEPVDQAGSIIIQAKNGKEFTIMPIQLTKHNCRVSCNCMDFFWRFALYAHKGDSLLGTDLGIYKKRTDRPPVNPKQVPALCKHLLKLAVELKNNGVVK